MATKCMHMSRSAPAVMIGALTAFSSCTAEKVDVTFDWNNDEIGDNNLGRLARACSARHCRAEVDALDLWLSLREVSA